MRRHILAFPKATVSLHSLGTMLRPLAAYSAEQRYPLTSMPRMREHTGAASPLNALEAVHINPRWKT